MQNHMFDSRFPWRSWKQKFFFIYKQNLYFVQLSGRNISASFSAIIVRERKQLKAHDQGNWDEKCRRMLESIGYDCRHSVRPSFKRLARFQNVTAYIQHCSLIHKPSRWCFDWEIYQAIKRFQAGSRSRFVSIFTDFNKSWLIIRQTGEEVWRGRVRWRLYCEINSVYC